MKLLRLTLRLRLFDFPCASLESINLGGRHQILASSTRRSFGKVETAEAREGPKKIFHYNLIEVFLGRRWRKRCFIDTFLMAMLECLGRMQNRTLRGHPQSSTEAASVWRSNGFTEFPLIKGIVKHERSRFRTISTLVGIDKATRRRLA